MTTRISTKAAFMMVAALAPLVWGCSDTKDEGPTAWQGKTYLLDIPASHWTQPKDAGQDMGAFVPKFVLEVTKSVGGSAEILLGTQDEAGNQDLCNPTSVIKASQSYPTITLEPSDVPLHIVNTDRNTSVNATAYGLSGTDILPGTEPAKIGTFTATMDARHLYPMFYLVENATADSVCSALEKYDSPCQACPADGAKFCVTLKATQIVATELTGVTVQTVSASSLGASCAPKNG